MGETLQDAWVSLCYWLKCSQFGRRECFSWLCISEIPREDTHTRAQQRPLAEAFCLVTTIEDVLSVQMYRASVPHELFSYVDGFLLIIVIETPTPRLRGLASVRWVDSCYSAGEIICEAVLSGGFLLWKMSFLPTHPPSQLATLISHCPYFCLSLMGSLLPPPPSLPCPLGVLSPLRRWRTKTPLSFFQKCPFPVHTQTCLATGEPTCHKRSRLHTPPCGRQPGRVRVCVASVDSGPWLLLCFLSPSRLSSWPYGLSTLLTASPASMWRIQPYICTFVLKPF